MSRQCEIGAPCGAAEGPLTSTSSTKLSSFLGFLQRVIKDVIRYRSFRAAEKELQALDDRMLNDIGIDRSEITSALLNASNERRNIWRM